MTNLLELTWYGMFHPDLPRDLNVRRGADAIAALASDMEALVDSRPQQHRQYCRAVLSEVRELAERCFQHPEAAKDDLESRQIIGKVSLAFTMQ